MNQQWKKEYLSSFNDQPKSKMKEIKENVIRILHQLDEAGIREAPEYLKKEVRDALDRIINMKRKES